MPESDLAERAKTMRRLRDDARERGPKLKPLALFYAQEALRLTQERLKLLAGKIKGSGS